MCNRYRLTAKQAEVAATFGIRAPYEVDETFPVGDIFLMGKRRHSMAYLSCRMLTNAAWREWNGVCRRKFRVSVILPQSLQNTSPMYATCRPAFGGRC